MFLSTTFPSSSSFGPTIIENLALVAIYDLTGPQGVRGRNSDNTAVYAALGWEPKVELEDGMRTVYHWIENQLIQEGRIAAASHR